MVSFWPWKGQDNTPASFEKTLSALSKKIAATTARLDSQRQRTRRFKALWTLYTTFGYLIYSLILVLGVGWDKWGVIEFATVIAGPPVIYAVRAVAAKIFEYRVSKTEKHLKDLNKQRQETIEKLKVATKYNSTQELLEKYGGETPPKSTAQENQSVGLKGKEDERRAGGAIQQQFTGRTGIPPPPTANIRRQQDERNPVAPSQSPQPIPRNGSGEHQSGTNSGGRVSMLPQDIYSGFEEPGFAPNAFPTPHYSDSQHRWYDRLLDVLLGEDETLPRNRIALICQNCRLVNGQAPPGVKTLEEIGRWRCGSCGAWNNSESEARKILDNITKSQTVDQERETVDDHPDILESTDESTTSDSAILVDRAEDHRGSEDGEQSEHEAKEDSEPPTTKNKRGRPKWSRKKA